MGPWSRSRAGAAGTEPATAGGSRTGGQAHREGVEMHDAEPRVRLGLSTHGRRTAGSALIRGDAPHLLHVLCASPPAVPQELPGRVVARGADHAAAGVGP